METEFIFSILEILLIIVIFIISMYAVFKTSFLFDNDIGFCCD